MALMERTRRATKENLSIFDMTGNSLGVELALKCATDRARIVTWNERTMELSKSKEIKGEIAISNPNVDLTFYHACPALRKSGAMKSE